MSNELERVLANPDNFLVSKSLAEKFEEPIESRTGKFPLPTLEVVTDNDESFNVSVLSWSKSTKDGYYQFKCKSKKINDIYSIGGIYNIDKLTIIGIGATFSLDVQSYEFFFVDPTEHKFIIKVY